MDTSRKLSKREKIGKLSWPILILLLVVFPSFFLFNVAVGLILTTCNVFLFWKFYPKDEISEEEINSRKSFLKLSEKIFWYAVISLVSLGVIVAVFGPNEQQKKLASEYKIDSSEFLKIACHSKSACKDYAESRLSCATTGNIQECIKIKTHGEDFGACTEDENIADFGDTLVPTFAQCIGNKIILFAR